MCESPTSWMFFSTTKTKNQSIRYAANGRRIRLPAVGKDTTYPWGGFSDVVNRQSELAGELSLRMVGGDDFV